MKKQSLHLIAALLITQNSFAQISFLESVVSENSSSYEVVKEEIAEWAKTPGRYLSLGESHMESETVNPINFSFAKIFRDNLKNRYTFCSETIADFLDSKEGKDLQSQAEKVLIFTGNNPAKTDFTGCKWKSKSSAITYSGFYHQYPFAKAWPADFPVSPVTSEPDNNINSQLAPKQGLFITQMETMYAESLATRNLLNNKTLNAETFKSRINELIKNSERIRSKMSLLLGAESDLFKNKYGVFLPKSALNADVKMPEKSWILMTHRGYQLNSKRLQLLSKVAELTVEEISAFQQKLRSGKPYYVSMMFGPDENGTRARTTYGGVEMDGEAELIQMGELMIVLDHNANEFKCYQVNNTDHSATEVLCKGRFF